MPDRLFGTDGVRGVAGEYPLDRDTVTRLGATIVRALDGSRAPTLLVGRDTRESGQWIEEALARGATAVGATIVSAGVLPTPAIAELTRAETFDAGVVISASHNPYRDNGIKLFGPDGQKVNDRLEVEVERLLADEPPLRPVDGPAPLERRDFRAAYVEYVSSMLSDPGRLGSLRIAMDCANGATFEVGPLVFRRLGLHVEVLSNEPNGRNINLTCGSTAPAMLADVVRERGCDVGVAFDGDGDRAILVDERGQLVDGDALLLVCAVHLKGAGCLPGDTVVATVMSNIGLEVALRRHGITLVRCPVGDRFVSQEMKARGSALGGEQSGHVIRADHGYTGDGIVTALSVLRAMADSGRTLAELVVELEVYPQVLVNVRVREKRELSRIDPVADVLAHVRRQLADQGRLVVRYSGTEPLLRVMIEGRDQTQIRAWADEIAAVVESQLGAGSV